MNLKKFLCLFLLITVVLAVASCNKPKQYTVTFNNDGEIFKTQTVNQGARISNPGAPVKEGFTFLGWFNGSTEWDFTSPVNGNLTLTAHWEKNANEDPPKPNPEDCVEHVDQDGDGKCDVCLFIIKDETIQYSITYMDGNKKLTKLEPAHYTYSSLEEDNLDLPKAPAKSHYEFVGWYTDKALTKLATYVDVNQQEDLIFYAKYSPVTYTLTYNLDGGVNSENNPEKYTVKDLTVTLEDPTKEGHVFLGWYTDNAFTQPITEITRSNIGNLTVYARWAKLDDQYTVTYLDHYGNELLVDHFFKSDSDQLLKDYTEFEALTVPGYSFIAWVDAEDESIVYNCIPAGTAKNIVVKANLKNAATHNLLYYVDNEFYFRGTFLEVDGLGELLVPVKGGYTFDGWYTNIICAGEKITSIPANTLEDIKLYGKFVPNTYTVTFEIDGVITDLGLGTYDTSDADIALPAIPEKAGYHVLGWFTKEGQIMEENKIAAGYFGNLELVAVYAKNTYNITYYLNGGINDENNVAEYLHDEVPTLHDPSKSGYKFAGWYTDASFSGTPIEDLTAYANQDVSLFALWIPDIDGDSSTLTPEVPF